MMGTITNNLISNKAAGYTKYSFHKIPFIITDTFSVGL
jgi:hypothetical protein